MAIGMEVRHPDYGTGKVVALSENAADIQFEDGLKSVNPQFTELHPLKATAELSGLEIPLEELIDRIARTAVDRSMAQTMETSTQELGAKWHGGHMELIPGNQSSRARKSHWRSFSIKSLVFATSCACWSKRSTPMLF